MLERREEEGEEWGSRGRVLCFFPSEGGVLVVLPCHHPVLIIPPYVRVPWWRSLPPHPASSSTLTGLDGVKCESVCKTDCTHTPHPPSPRLDLLCAPPGPPESWGVVGPLLLCRVSTTESLTHEDWSEPDWPRWAQHPCGLPNDQVGKGVKLAFSHGSS